MSRGAQGAIWAAVITGAVSLIGYYLTYVRPKGNENTDYAVRIVDDATGKGIPDAEVVVEQDQNAPIRFKCDSDGVCHATLPTAKNNVLRVNAKGYDELTRTISLARSGTEYIRLRQSRSPQSPSPPHDTPHEYVSFTLPDGVKFRSAVKLLSQTDGFSPDFRGCAPASLDAELEGSRLRGRSTVELIEALKLHFKNTELPPAYNVKKMPDKGIYEIDCSD